MKRHVVWIGLITSVIVGNVVDLPHHTLGQHTSRMQEVQAIENYPPDYTFTREGVKALLEYAIKKIEHLKNDYGELEKTLQQVQQELATFKKEMTLVSPADNERIKSLQKEVKKLKVALVVCFGATFLYEAFFFYATHQELL